MYYTGVGTRDITQEISKIIYDIGVLLAKKNYTLMSGGADGADMSFEQGCDSVNGKKEIYLPWKGFNNNNSNLYKITDEMLKLASEIHPAWRYLKQGAQKLHARNCCQVLGQNLDSPSEFLVCYTKNGEKIGGTRTAIILAENNNIPVYNLAILGDYDRLMKRIK